ncbi:MAG: FlgD immunoglobulin-like domain containing protein, partial [Candidatus Eiseniibacteriota bacterium]
DAGTGDTTGWNPDASSNVNAIAVAGSTIYAGGAFSTVHGEARNWIAALDASTGIPTAWDAKVEDVVYSIAVSGQTVYVGGNFTFVGGVEREFLASIDASTGDLTPWFPKPNGQVWALATSGISIYAGGDFSYIGNESQSFIAGFTELPTAVTLVTVNAESDASGIHISWYAPGDRIVSTSVYRRTEATDWAFAGHPQPNANHYIAYEDKDVTAGTRYGYRLLVRDASGAETAAETWVTATGVAGAPRVVTLAAARPNPFGARAQLAYGLPQGGKVRLAVFDVQGRRVATVVDRVEPAGWRSVVWDGRNSAGQLVASGTYFERLEVEGVVQIKKMVIAR